MCEIGGFQIGGIIYFWWKRLQAERKKDGRALINSWLMMKELLEDEFILLDREPISHQEPIVCQISKKVENDDVLQGKGVNHVHH